MVVIINYGVGNLGSILNMLRHIGVDGKISAGPADIEEADRLILPGVGAFDTGMTRLKESGYIPLLEHKVLDEKTPVLGICLGMQMLTEKSEEGTLPGLGWVAAETRKFSVSDTTLRIPHMGWNTVDIKKDAKLVRGLDQNARFYFVHSYHVVCRQAGDILADTHYGYDFTSMLQSGNVMGTQFHPEKSHRYGMQILKNFAECPI